MSGIYLTVWDKAQPGLLSATKGGWPHVTLAYSGKHLSRSELVELSHRCFADWALGELTLVGARVNSFEKTPGIMRHDVLLDLAASDAAAIRGTRQMYLSHNSKSANFVMREPHVTHSIHSTLVDAQAMVDHLNATSLPRVVRVTGVAID